MQFIKNLYQSVKNAVFSAGAKTLAVIGSAAALVGLGSLPQRAEAATYIDPAVSGVFTQLQADTTTIAGYGWGLLSLILAITVIMGLVKKFAKKGAA